MSEVNQQERAARAWPLLTRLAENSGTTTYKDLGRQLGIHHRAIGFVLAVIQKFCLTEKLPPITILVTGQAGLPGDGFIAWDVDDLGRGFDLVYNYPWSELDNPFGFAADGSTVESLADEVFNHVLSPKDAYSRVKVRGMAQLVFRSALLKAYGARCALSKVLSPELLEAAHIIPWSKAHADQRVNPRNGLLLSTIHHRFFDLGWLRVNDDYTITADLTKTKADSFERQLLIEVDGSKLRLPLDIRHWPDPEFIRQRNKDSQQVAAEQPLPSAEFQ